MRRALLITGFVFICFFFVSCYVDSTGANSSDFSACNKLWTLYSGGRLQLWYSKDIKKIRVLAGMLNVCKKEYATLKLTLGEICLEDWPLVNVVIQIKINVVKEYIGLQSQSITFNLPKGTTCVKPKSSYEFKFAGRQIIRKNDYVLLEIIVKIPDFKGQKNFGFVTLGRIDYEWY